MKEKYDKLVYSKSDHLENNYHVSNVDRLFSYVIAAKGNSPALS